MNFGSNGGNGSGGSGAHTYKCPNCNGYLSWDAKSGSMRCSHCGYAPEDVSEVSASIPVGDETSVEEREELLSGREKVKGVDEFLAVAPWVEGANAAKSYHCDACGAEVMADATVVSTECPYCGNVLLVSGVADATNVPSQIVPFKVDEAAAREQLANHFQKKWYLPKAFDAYTEHVRSVYVPFRLFDIHVEGWANFVGDEEHTHTDSDGDTHTTHEYWGLYRAGEADFGAIPVDGSTRMPDAHMDAVGPYDTSELVDFDAAYVAGHMAEVADEPESTGSAKATSLATSSFEADLRRDAERSRADSVEVVGQGVTTQTNDVRLVSLPVWLVHCSWAGEQMLFAVNGQTGKCIGDLPVAGGKRALTCILAFLVPAIVAFGLLLVVTDGIDVGKAIGALVVAAIVALVTDSIFMGQVRTAKENVNASSAFEGGGTRITESATSRRSYGTANAVKRKWFNGSPETRNSHMG